MEQVTKNVYAETGIRGCNPSIVLTEEGSVFIDTAQLITPLLKMRAFAKERGPIRALINTESHIDHIFGNHWFAGECPVIGHKLLEKTFFCGTPFDCYDNSVDIITRQDPEGLPFMPSREDYVVNKPQVTFDHEMTFALGSRTFQLYHTPGHSPSNISVFVPEERVAFVGDTIFSECQIWFHSADPDALLNSLRFLRSLDCDYYVPGHGPVVEKPYIDKQMAFIYDWLDAVANGVARGWSKDECMERISFADRCPVDIGQEDQIEYITKANVSVLYDYITRNS